MKSENSTLFCSLVLNIGCTFLLLSRDLPIVVLETSSLGVVSQDLYRLRSAIRRINELVTSDGDIRVRLSSWFKTSSFIIDKRG